MHRARPVQAVLGLITGLATALALVLVLPPTATAAPEPWQPAGTIDLVGHGYGHGHGLSQYGAQGAALKGLNYWQIVRFYYPGTGRATFSARVKVLVTRDNDATTVVRPRSGLQVRDLGSRTSHALPSGRATLWRLRTLADGRVQVAFHAPRAAKPPTWFAWRVLAGSGEFRASGPMELRVADGVRAYRGFLRHVDRSTVNVVRMDDYLKGVVPAEMPASWRMGALRAQVVAARTFALHERARRRGAFELYDDTRSQVYGGVAAEQPSTNRAVDLTPGTYLTYGGGPAYAQFSASSGGWTAAGSQPYLVARPDPYDDYPANRVHTWRKTVGTAALQRRHPQLGKLVRLRVTQRDGNGEWGGRVLEVQLDGTRSDVRVSGTDLRWALGLRSTWFRFE